VNRSLNALCDPRLCTFQCGLRVRNTYWGMRVLVLNFSTGTLIRPGVVSPDFFVPSIPCHLCMYVVIDRCTIVARQDGIDKDKAAQCYILCISDRWILEYKKCHKNTRVSALDSRISRILALLHELQLTRRGSPMMTTQVCPPLCHPDLLPINLVWNTNVEARGMRGCEIGRLRQ
jgi:hypothetical protein